MNDPTDAHLYTNNMDFHPFGAWLANEAARVARHTHADGKQRRASVMAIVDHIHKWKVSNGEEIHGFLWQSTRLLAYDTGTLDGRRLADPKPGPAIEHVMTVCKPTWWLAAQTRDDCSHAAGHGFFYYFLDVGKAVSAAPRLHAVHRCLCLTQRTWNGHGPTSSPIRARMDPCATAAPRWPLTAALH